MTSRKYSVGLAQEESDWNRNLTPNSGMFGASDSGKSGGHKVLKNLLSLELNELSKRPFVCRLGGLYAAVRDGALDYVTEVLASAENKRKLNEADETGFTALHQAARYNHVDVVRTLLDHGALINVRSREDAITPLQIASRLDILFM